MNTFIRHIILWISIYVVYTYMMSFYDDYKARMVSNLVNVPLFMLAYYLLKHVQIPLFYEKGKMLVFALSIIASSYCIGAVCRINGILWMDNFFGKDSDEIPFMTMGSYLLKTVRYYTPAMAILAWESHQARKKELVMMQELEKEKIATELKFLKAQINPHFLFNTLNNLYSYVVTQSPRAPEIIIQLSGILDYVLYKSQNKTVTLQQEVEAIEHFIKLEKIRYGSRLQVDYKVEGKMTLPISPLILLSLVENAFKHGVSGDIDNPKVRVEIQENNEIIHCEVWNTKTKYEGELNDAYKEGIGLSNVKRQLNLIYPDHHQLTIEDLEETFCVQLSINPMV